VSGPSLSRPRKGHNHKPTGELGSAQTHQGASASRPRRAGAPTPSDKTVSVGGVRTRRQVDRGNKDRRSRQRRKGGDTNLYRNSDFFNMQATALGDHSVKEKKKKFERGGFTDF